MHPKLGTIEDFDDFVTAARDQGLEVALDLALQAAPDHPWAKAASGVVHGAARRHHRLRGEPAEEVPGHLPDQLRQRPRRHLRRGAARGAVLDQPRSQDLSRRQPAHQAAELLGVADRTGQGDRSRCAVPRRGVHPARPPLRPGQAGFHPVLQLLHLAHREVGADRVRRADRRARRLRPPQPVRQHARHPARKPATRRSGHVRHPGGAGVDVQSGLGRVFRLRTVRAPRGARGQRGVPRLGEVRVAPPRFRGAPWPGASRWSRS